MPAILRKQRAGYTIGVSSGGRTRCSEEASRTLYLSMTSFHWISILCRNTCRICFSQLGNVVSLSLRTQPVSIHRYTVSSNSPAHQSKYYSHDGYSSCCVCDLRYTSKTPSSMIAPHWIPPTSFGLADPKSYSSYQQEPTFPLCFGIEQIEVAHLRRSTT